MKSTGNTGTYSGGTQGIPVPRYDGKPRDAARTHAAAKPKPTGLDWTKHRAPDAAPEYIDVRDRRARCSGCRKLRGGLNAQGMCPACADALEHRMTDTESRPPQEESSTSTTTSASTSAPSDAAVSADAPTTTPASTPSPASTAAPASLSPATGPRRTSAPAATTDPPTLAEVTALLHACRTGLAAEVDKINQALARLDALLLAERPDTPPAATTTRETPEAVHGPASSGYDTFQRPRRPHVTLTRPQIDEIVERYQHGETAPAIAAAFGVLPKRIRQELTTRGVTLRDDRHRGANRKRPEDDDPALVDQVRRLYLDQGKSQQQIADTLGVSQRVINRLMSRHQIPTRPQAHRRPGRLAEHTADIIRLYLDDMLSAGQIAARYAAAAPSIRKLLLRNGVQLRGRTEAIRLYHHKDTEGDTE